MDLSYLASHLSSSFIPNAVIIDATASDVPPAHYLEVSTGLACKPRISLAAHPWLLSVKLSCRVRGQTAACLLAKARCRLVTERPARAQWMGKGINIITPNKKLSSGPYERYQQLKKLQRQSYMHYFYEVHAHDPPTVPVSVLTVPVSVVSSCRVRPHMRRG